MNMQLSEMLIVSLIDCHVRARLIYAFSGSQQKRWLDLRYSCRLGFSLAVRTADFKMDEHKKFLADRLLSEERAVSVFIETVPDLD